MNGTVALHIVHGGDFLSCHERIILVVVAEAVAAPQPSISGQCRWGP